MKFSTISSLILLRQVSAGTCPSELTETVSLHDGLATMYYAIDADILCARIESQTEGWVAWGISPTGLMAPAEAVIGLPDEQTVLKYGITAKDISGVVAMSSDKQTLTDTSITQEGGVTTMTFTKILEEDEYPLIIGLNNCTYAMGDSNELGYHGSNRGSFEFDLSSSQSDALNSTTVAPSPSATLTGTLPATAESITTPAPASDDVTSDEDAAAEGAAAEGSPGAGLTLSSVASAAAIVGAAALF